MFKKKKRLLSVILTLCMIVSVILGSTITVNATEPNTDTTLDSLVINSFPKAEAGEIMVTEKNLTIEGLPTDVEVVVEWQDENEKITTDTKMEEGHVYTAMIYVDATFSSYTLSNEFLFKIDGTEYGPTIMDPYNQSPLWAQLDLEYELTKTNDDVDDSNNTNNNDANNTNSNDNKDSSTVKTGDSSMILLWMVLAVVSMGTVVFVRRKRA